MESKSTIMPAFTICPNYDSSYNATRLQDLGIPGRDSYRREGIWEGNSGAGQRGVFDMVAHKLEEIVEHIDSQEDRGHQSSGARAPELWCPHIFFRGFLDGVLTFMLAVFR